MNNKRSCLQRGFTMIEMLTVLVIIGVLMTVSLITYGNARQKSRLAAVKANVSEIVLALDDFQRDHSGSYPALTDYHTTVPEYYSTIPSPPGDPPAGYPAALKWKGNAIIGGGPKLADNTNVLQDDFYTDLYPPASLFRNRQGEVAFGNGPMLPVDQLVRNGQMDAYPLNPLAGPGIPMVNIAHILYQYDTQTNDAYWVQFTLTSTGETRMGLCAARPVAGGVYMPIDVIWNETTYPQGDFAYIPFEFTTEQGNYCNGYWIISYGDLNTLAQSPYNKFASNTPPYDVWPNFPPPYGDGNPATPPDPNSFEYQVKRLMLGALDVRATIFGDQLTLD